MENQSEKMRPQVGVGVYVFKEGKVLLGKRKNAHGDGEWACPGGHLEFGESLEDCASRELAEETGLRALSVKDGGWSNDVIGGNKHYITLVGRIFLHALPEDHSSTIRMNSQSFLVFGRQFG